VVRNVGQAALPAGVNVGFYLGTPPGGTKLGAAATTIALYPAESQTVSIPIPAPDPGIASGAQPVYAVVDDGAAPHPAWAECRTDDDTSAPAKLSCGGPN
jgi:hypothetical protein